MKKTVKRILFGVGCFAAVVVCVFVAFSLKARSEMGGMAALETHEVAPGVFAIKDSTVNVFLIKDGTRYVAVDAGNDLDAVSKGLKKLRVVPDSVEAVLLTHTDADHVAALGLFRRAEVFLSRPEEALINGKQSRMMFIRNEINASKYTLLDDRQVFGIGGLEIKGYLNPGHTPGSMSYQINQKYLFVGDALRLKHDKIFIFNELFNMDTPLATKSMDVLTNIPGVEYLFTAHYGYTKHYKKAARRWIEDR